MALAKGTTDKTIVEDIFAPQVSRKKGSMKVAAGAMGIIVDRLIDMYRFPVESTVREVVSNAIDAIMKLPPELRRAVVVTSPTVESPYLVVEDFGIGMSPQVIEENLLNFGGSFDKRENFDQLGAYGLGAKAPLAYTNEFFVTSVCNGELTEVTVTRDSYGNEWELSTHKTAKPSGTRVTIPVRPEDFQAFADILNSYRFYSRDVEVVIDGQASTFDEDLVYLDNILLTEHEDKETGAKTPVYGDVWVSREALLSRPRDMLSLPWEVDFLLSGWLYRARQERSSGFQKAKGMVVELKPGVLDYSSSRDDIVQNERFQQLISRLRSSYSPVVQGRLNGVLFERLLAAYKNFSAKDALLFASNYCLRVGDEGEVVTTLLSQSPRLGFKLAALTTTEGFNPLDLRSVPQASVNIFSGLARPSYGKKDTFSLLALSTPKISRHYQSIYSTIRDRLTITETQTKLEESLANLSGDQPLLGYAFAQFLNSSYYGNQEKMTVVEGVNADFLKLMKSKRKLVMKELPEDGTVLLSRGAVTSYDKEVTKLLGITLIVVGADKLSEKVLAAKAAQRKPRQAVATGPTRVAVYYLGQAEDALDTVAKLSERSYRRGYLTVEEAVTLGHVILVRSAQQNAPSSLVPLLNGLANTGVQSQGHQVIAVDEKELKAADFKLLGDYSRVYLTAELKTSVKAADPLKARRGLVQNDAFLNSTVQESSLGALLHAYFTNYHVRYSVNYAALVAVSQEVLKLDNSLTAVKLVAANPLTGDSEQDNDFRSHYTVDGLLKRKVGAEVYRELALLRETVARFNMSGYVFASHLETIALGSALYAQQSTDEDKAIFKLLLPKTAQQFALAYTEALLQLEKKEA